MLKLLLEHLAPYDTHWLSTHFSKRLVSYQQDASGVTLHFADGSPGMVPITMPDWLKFLESLSSSPGLKRILSWLRTNKVHTYIYMNMIAGLIFTTGPKVISFAMAPDVFGTLLPWARWNSPCRWLPEELYDRNEGFQNLEAFVTYWKKHVNNLVKSPDYVEHLALAIGLVLRDIHAIQFAVNDPDDVDSTPPYCEGGPLTIQYEDSLVTFLRLVADTLERLPQGKRSTDVLIINFLPSILKTL